jgi:hypothetical protein
MMQRSSNMRDNIAKDGKNINVSYGNMMIVSFKL